jgi:hypothetical protein
MKKILFIVALFCFMFNVAFVFAESDKIPAPPLQEAFIKTKKIGWQTYEFTVATNLPQDIELEYEWTVDHKESYNADKLHYFFSQGEHVVQVKVEDGFGNTRYDKVRMSIRFWSLENNWFWWLLYVMLSLVILYYWVAKLIYLFNKRKLDKNVREFFSILDEHGWVEKLIAEHLLSKQRASKGEK